MIYHKRSKGTPLSLPSENRKGKRKMTNNKVMVEIIEEEHPSNELVSRLEQKISCYSLSIPLWSQTWISSLPQIKPFFKINLHLLNQAPFICLQITPTSQITIFLPNMTHMLLDLHILLRAHRILPYKFLDIKCLFTKSLGIA